jgi:hypothetical protein
MCFQYYSAMSQRAGHKNIIYRTLELLYRHRLRQMFVKSRVFAFFDVFCHAKTAQGDCWKFSCEQKLFDDVMTRAVWKPDITDEQIEKLIRFDLLIRSVWVLYQNVSFFCLCFATEAQR